MKCDATAKSTGKRCGRNAVPGLKKCRIHCGLSKDRQKEIADGHRMEQKVGAFLAREHVEYQEGQELDGLLLEVARSAIVVQELGKLVASLEDPNDEDAKDTEAGTMLWGPDHLGDAAPHVVFNLWNQERERHARFCKMALDAGVNERQVRVAEAQGQMLAKVVSAILDDPELKLTAAQRKKAPKVARKHLELVG